jgi:hypothetical protein
MAGFIYNGFIYIIAEKVLRGNCFIFIIKYFFTVIQN